MYVTQRFFLTWYRQRWAEAGLIVRCIINLIGTAHMMITGKLPGTADEYETMMQKGEREKPVGEEHGNEDAENAAALFAPPRV